MEKQNRSELIAKRLKECDKNNELNYKEQVELVQYFAHKLNLTTKSIFAKENNVSYNGLKLRIKEHKEMIIKLNGIELICN